jgi:hypothetical protein
MADGLSVRRAADRLGVHHTTALRWRHRWLDVARETKARRLAGVVEADETDHLKSFKGQKALLAASTKREPRRRGGVGSKRGTSTGHTPILALVNRHGDTTDHVLKSTNAVDLKAALPGVLAEDAVLCTDGSSALRRAALDLGAAHEAVPTRWGSRTRGPWHFQNVNAYHSRFKGWVRRFHGISSRYLTNYLGWFRAPDRSSRAKAPPSALLAPAIGI